jgi:glutaminyl-peptide cyclotransferase
MGKGKNIRKARSWHLIMIFLIAFLLISLLLGFLSSPRILFNENKAFEHLTYMVKLGPRTSGSPALRESQKYIEASLEKFGFMVKELPFDAATPLGKVPMKNILGSRQGRNENVLLLAAHYETKKFTEFTFVGANDGASGTAVLLELARILPERTKNLTLMLAFFDGEESFGPWSESDGLYGSRNFVETMGREGTLQKVRAMILLDMVGDESLSINRDCNSTPWLEKLMQDTAHELRLDAYFGGREIGIDDDHIPFIMAGVPALDIIDMDYACWHTRDDDLRHVRKESLGIVGSVVERMVEKLEGASTHH